MQRVREGEEGKGLPQTNSREGECGLMVEHLSKCPMDSISVTVIDNKKLLSSTFKIKHNP